MTSEDLRNGPIVLQTPGVSESLAADQTVEGESAQDIDDGCRVRAGARQRIKLAQPIEQAGAFKEVIPRDQTAVIAEVVFANSGKVNAALPRLANREASCVFVLSSPRRRLATSGR